jgi:hypothetical protein
MDAKPLYLFQSVVNNPVRFSLGDIGYIYKFSIFSSSNNLDPSSFKRLHASLSTNPLIPVTSTFLIVIWKSC